MGLRWKGDDLAKGIVRFLAIFVIALVVLVLPWPTGAYLGMFRALVTLVFSNQEGQREVIFLDAAEPTRRTTNTRVEIANRDLLHLDGSGPVRYFDFNGFRACWLPTALLIALTIASPVPLARRFISLAWGLPSLQIALLAFLAVVIWNESSSVGLLAEGSLGQVLACQMQSHFATPFALGAPLLIWLLATFRHEDFAPLRRPQS